MSNKSTFASESIGKKAIWLAESISKKVLWSKKSLTVTFNLLKEDGGSLLLETGAHLLGER